MPLFDCTPAPLPDKLSRLIPTSEKPLALPPADPTTQDQPESPGADDPDPSQPVVVDVVLHIDEPDPPIARWLDEQFRRVLSLCGVGRAEVSLVIVADDEMAQLHESYTGVPGTTDVLTFDLRESAGDACVEGEIILCLDEAKRQAGERNHPVRHELLLYAVHGLLHLLGEDDHDEAAYQRMHAREDALLRELGLGPVFATDTTPGGTGVPPVDRPSNTH